MRKSIVKGNVRDKSKVSPPKKFSNPRFHSKSVLSIRNLRRAVAQLRKIDEDEMKLELELEAQMVEVLPGIYELRYFERSQSCLTER